MANTSLLIAVLVYMGWAFDDALYGYFHIRPLDLNFSIVEYMLRSLALFSVTIVVVAVALIAISVVRTWGLGKTRFARRVAGTVATRVTAIPALRRLVSADSTERSQAGRILMIGTGAAITAIALVLAWISNYVQVSTYLFLFLIGSGPLMMTRPTRADHRGRFPYALAIVVSRIPAASSPAVESAATRSTDRAVCRIQPLATALDPASASSRSRRPRAFAPGSRIDQSQATPATSQTAGTACQFCAASAFSHVQNPVAHLPRPNSHRGAQFVSYEPALIRRRELREPCKSGVFVKPSLRTDD